MAENRTVCVKVCGTESCLAPYRYIECIFPHSLHNPNNVPGQSKRCVNVSLLLGCSLLTGADCLQLWSRVDSVKSEDVEEKPTDMIMKDARSAWRCTWQSK